MVSRCGRFPVVMDALEVRAHLSGDPLPSTSVPAFSSHSSAYAKLYLDFRGAASQTWGSYQVTQTPAYDTDGDASLFSNTEQTAIQEIWARVAEKYSPFNVDVTTIDPGTYDYGRVARIVIGGDGAWTGGTFGGFSYPSGFTGSTSNTGWVFPKNLGQGRPKYVAESAAHEAGHLFRLIHQSAFDANGTEVNEYRGGRDPLNPNLTDPVMGFSYYAVRGVWSNGPSINANTMQDDMAILTGYNGFGYRVDDRPNAPSQSSALVLIDGVNASASGIIERTTDLDYFTFYTNGGEIVLRANVAAVGPTLDLSFYLYDANGQLLVSQDTTALGETIRYVGEAGDYYVAVGSHGAYGDVGTYSITGTVVPEPVGSGLVMVAAFALIAQRPSRKEKPKDMKEQGRQECLPHQSSL